MTRLRPILIFAICSLGIGLAVGAEQPGELEIEALNDQGWVEYNLTNHIAIGTNGVMVRYAGAVLTADKVTMNEATEEAFAEGSVRIAHDDQIWVGEQIFYNFQTREMRASHFRTGRPPVFAEGEGLHGTLTNRAYVATNAFVTTDDIADPVFKVRAKYIQIIPGKKMTARNALLYVAGVPVFYFPFYTRNLGEHVSNFNFLPGYRSIFGPYLLIGYTFWLSQQLDGILHVDERTRRGPGLGPTLNYHLGRWGDGTFKYYYQYDGDPSVSATNGSIPHNRQRVNFSYLANPFTNLEVRTVARYQGDSNMVREFFESEYRQNPQPDSYLEANKFWRNFSLDAYAQPRFDDFLETVERLPEVRLTGYRQEVGSSPIYYESQSTAGNYRRLFIQTNGVADGTNFGAARADTFHQMVLPETLFGWLNITPRVGGRYTWCSAATGPGATTGEESRGVFNTGIEISLRASRLWPDVQSGFLEMDGLRHIIEPSVNYSFVPKPNVVPGQLPQFDYELPSLRLLPIDFPEYNAIDSIDSQNTVRWGLRNKFQTKRQGEVVNLANWDVYTDWRLTPRSGQSTFSDIYSDLTIRPRSWLTLESVTRYDIEHGLWTMAFHDITLQPVNAFSWSIGQYYLRDDLSGLPTALGIGNNLFTSTITYRLNENWGLRAVHRFEARNGDMEEQAYTVYRDLRSWTAALTLRVLQNPTGPQDVTVAFTFSLKAQPHYGLGSDTGRPYSLLGG